MTGDGAFFPDLNGSQFCYNNAKSILNYHPVLQFNGNKNDFWLLFDDKEILVNRRIRVPRKPKISHDVPTPTTNVKIPTLAINADASAEKPGFENTFVDTTVESGFLKPKDEDDNSQTRRESTLENATANAPSVIRDCVDNPSSSLQDLFSKSKGVAKVYKEAFKELNQSRIKDSSERRRSRSRDRSSPTPDRKGGAIRRIRESRRSRSRGRGRSRSRGKVRSRSKDRDRSRNRGRDRSRDRGRDQSRNEDRNRSRERKWKRSSPSSNRKYGSSKKASSSSSVSSSSSSDSESEKSKTGKSADILKKFAQKLQEKSKVTSSKISLSSIRLSSRLEDTKHRRGELVTPIVFSLKKSDPLKASPDTTHPKTSLVDKKLAEIELPKEKVADPVNIELPKPVSTDEREPLPLKQCDTPSKLQDPPKLVKKIIPPPVQASSTLPQPMRVSDGVTVACAPTLYKAGTKTPVTNTVMMIPPPKPVSRPSPTVTVPSQTVTETPPDLTQPPPQIEVPPPQMSDIQHQLAAQAYNYAAMAQPPEGMVPGIPMQPGYNMQQYFGGPGSDFGTIRIPPGPPPGLPRPGHGIRPWMMGPGPRMMGPCRPEGPMMGPCGPEGPMMGPCGPEGPMMRPCGPEGPMMGPCGPEGPMMRPFGPEVPMMRPSGHGGSRMRTFGPDGSLIEPFNPNRPIMGSFGPEAPIMRPDGQQCGPTGHSGWHRDPSSHPVHQDESEKQKTNSTINRLSGPHQPQSNQKNASAVSENVLKSTDFVKTDIPNYEKIRFAMALLRFFQQESVLNKPKSVSSNSQSEEHVKKYGLVCKKKNVDDPSVLVIVVPENSNARRTIVTAFVLQYPDMGMDALVEFFERSFDNMPMEDIEDVFEDDSTRKSTLLDSIKLNLSKAKSISPSGKIIFLTSEKENQKDSNEIPSAAKTRIGETLDSSNDLLPDQTRIVKSERSSHDKNEVPVGEVVTSTDGDNKTSQFDNENNYEKPASALDRTKASPVPDEPNNIQIVEDKLATQASLMAAELVIQTETEPQSATIELVMDDKLNAAIASSTKIQPVEESIASKIATGEPKMLVELSFLQEHPVSETTFSKQEEVEDKSGSVVIEAEPVDQQTVSTVTVDDSKIGQTSENPGFRGNDETTNFAIKLESEMEIHDSGDVALSDTAMAEVKPLDTTYSEIKQKDETNVMSEPHCDTVENANNVETQPVEKAIVEAKIIGKECLDEVLPYKIESGSSMVEKPLCKTEDHSEESSDSPKQLTKNLNLPHQLASEPSKMCEGQASESSIKTEFVQDTMASSEAISDCGGSADTIELPKTITVETDNDACGSEATTKVKTAGAISIEEPILAESHSPNVGINEHNQNQCSSLNVDILTPVKDEIITCELVQFSESSKFVDPPSGDQCEEQVIDVKLRLPEATEKTPEISVKIEPVEMQLTEESNSEETRASTTNNHSTGVGTIIQRELPLTETLHGSIQASSSTLSNVTNLFTEAENNKVIKTDEGTTAPIDVKKEPTDSEFIDSNDQKTSQEIISPKTLPPRRFKSVYEMMKSVGTVESCELYEEPSELNIVNHDKLSFFFQRLKEIQQTSDILSVTNKMMFCPYDTSDQFVMQKGLLCKRKDMNQNEVFIALLKSTAIYREIVSALTEQYADLEFNEFMALIESSFTYITPADLISLSESLELKITTYKNKIFIRDCKIANYKTISPLLEQLKSIQKADSTLSYKMNRLKSIGGLDDSHIIKEDLVCHFTGINEFKVCLPNNQPDQISIMYIVHETNHDKNSDELKTLLRSTFEGVTILLLEKVLSFCSLCQPKFLLARMSKPKLPALKSLPPEVIYKIRQIQMASSVYKAQIDLLMKGQARHEGKYVLESSLLCKAVTIDGETVFRVIVSSSSLKEIASLLHATYHRKTLSEFVPFVNEFLLITEDICATAFQECYMCANTKSLKKSSDVRKSHSRSSPKKTKDDKGDKANKEETRRIESSKGSQRKQLKDSSRIETSRKETSMSSAEDSSGCGLTKDPITEPSMEEPKKKTTKDSYQKELSKRSSKDSSTTHSKSKTKEVRERVEISNVAEVTSDNIRRRVKKDLRVLDQVCGDKYLGNLIEDITRSIPENILEHVCALQRSSPELMTIIKKLECTKPMKNDEHVLCGSILFVVNVKTKMFVKIAVKEIPDITSFLVTKLHLEFHNWTISKLQAALSNSFDINPTQEIIEEIIEVGQLRKKSVANEETLKRSDSHDEQLKEPSGASGSQLGEENKEADDNILRAFNEDLLSLPKIWGDEIIVRLKACILAIPCKVLRKVILCQRDCPELLAIIEELETRKPVNDARHLICGGILFVTKTKKKVMMVKIAVKQIKNINYSLITTLHAECHDWNVNKLHTTIGNSFDISPSREELAVTIEWFCTRCQKPDTSSRKNKSSATLDEQLADFYSAIDPSTYQEKCPKDDDEQQDSRIIDPTQLIDVADVRTALANLPNSAVNRIQQAQVKSNVLNTQIKLLENTDGPAKGKRYCLVMSLLCKLVKLNEKIVWRVIIPLDQLKELVTELHTVHYHDMIEEDFFEFINMFMTVTQDIVHEVFENCAVCLTTVRRVPTLCERGVNEDFLRKTLATVSEMMDYIVEWQTKCLAIRKTIEGVLKAKPDVVKDFLIYKGVLFRVGKSKGGKSRPKIVASLLPDALDEVIKSTHAFYHKNNKNQLLNLINTNFDVPVNRNLLAEKIPALCNICGKRATDSQPEENNKAADSSSGTGTSKGFSDPAETDGEGNQPVIKIEKDDPPPLGVLLLGRLCDQVIEESSNSSRALDSPVPDISSTSEASTSQVPPVVRRVCKIIIKRCPYDPNIEQREALPEKKRQPRKKAPVKRIRKPKIPVIKEETVSSDDDNAPLSKKKYIIYSSDSDSDCSTQETPKKRKAPVCSPKNLKRKKK